jgi:23S rRNA pseudouridine2605 synthase
VEGIHYGPVEAALEREQGANVWISFAIREGKNREVRNVLAHLGLSVNRLIRVEFGPFGLGELPEGAIEEVETGNLRKQLGPRIIDRAGCDFSGPAAPPPLESRDERREHRHALRESLRDARRGSRDREDGPSHGTAGVSPAGRDARGPRDRDEQPEKPPGRPRRGHAWREDDAPLSRTYRGSRRDDLQIGEERPDKRTDVATDRKGRRVVVERFGTAKEKPEPAEAPARGRPPRRGPPRDRASGPRPSRPRLTDERADGTGSTGTERPRKYGDRADGRRDRHGERGSRPPRSRFAGERADRTGAERPRKFGDRAEGRRDRDGRRGEQGARPHGPRPSSLGPRTSGPRPPGSRPSGPRPPRKR